MAADKILTARAPVGHSFRMMRSLPAHLTVASLAAMVPLAIAISGQKKATEGTPPPSTDAVTFSPKPAPPTAPSDAATEPTADTLGTPFSQAAVNRAVANPDDYQAELELRHLIYSLPSGEHCIEMLDILNAVAAGSRPPLRQAYRDLFARWAELEPEAACKMGIQFHKTTGFEGEALAGAFHTFASADLDAALAWLEANGNSFFDHRELLAGAFSHILEHAKGYNTAIELFEIAKQLEASGRCAGIASETLALWARNVPPYNVMTAIEAMPEGPQRDEWTAQAIASMGIERPGSALGYLDRIADPERRAKVAHEVFWPYALTRTPDILRSPPDPVQKLEKEVGNWPAIVFCDAGNALTRHRASAALDKAKKIPSGPERDAFVGGMVDGAVFTEDPASVRSAIELASAEIRDDLLTQLEQQLQAPPTR